jgi:predicted nucleotide-binding protein (sugar kinase/HSP70/actin superfamily)
VRLLSTEINETAQPLATTLLKMARDLGAGKKEAKGAVQEAFVAMERHHRHDAQQQVSFDNRKFLLLGHPYTLHDRFIVDPIVNKLNQLRVPLERMNFGDNNIEPGLILWCIFNKMYRKLQQLDMHTYAGVIQLSTFNCGTDAMMTERFRRMCKHNGVPYLLLMLDEHSGRAGVDTRLEAFVDSLAWKGSAMTP